MLLIWTSALFLIPTWFAWRRNRRDIQYTCALLTLTSLGYHSSYQFISETDRVLAMHNAFCYPIDVVVAHTTSFFYLTKNVIDNVRHPTKVGIISTGFGLIGLFIYYFKSTCDNRLCFKWHGVVHGCAQLGYVVLTYGK